jgi:hypothetical protein
MQLHVELQNDQYTKLRKAIKILGFKTISEWVRAQARQALQDAKRQRMLEEHDTSERE